MYKPFNLTIKIITASNLIIYNELDQNCPSLFIYEAIKHYKYKENLHFDTIIKASIFIDILKNHNNGYLPENIHIVINQLKKLNVEKDLWILLD